MTTSHKNIRAVNLGQPPLPLTRRWREAVDEYADSLIEYPLDEPGGGGVSP